MRLRSVWVACWRSAFCAALFASCGGGSSGNAGGDGGTVPISSAPIPVADLCPVFTQDLCIYLMQCNHALYRDLAHCEAELDCYGYTQLQMSAAQRGVLYDPAQVGACNARFLSDPCGFAFFLFTPDIFEVLSLCPGTITPQRTAGQSCVSSGECTQGLYCKKDSGCPGICTPLAKAGESCAGSTPCASGLQCMTGASSPLSDVCQPTPNAGDACGTTVNCGSTENCPADPSACSNPNLWCDPATASCKPGVGEGAACGPTRSATLTGSIACASNLWCDQIFLDQPGTCRPSGGAGAPCNDTGCDLGLHCAGYVPLGAGATLGKCVGLSAAGGPCNTSSDCQGGIYCGNGTCGGGKPFGAACQEDSDCQAHFTCQSGMCVHAAYPGDACDGTTAVCVFSICRNGKCVDHAKVGEPCMVNDDCATGTCFHGTCADTSVCPAQ